MITFNEAKMSQEIACGSSGKVFEYKKTEEDNRWVIKYMIAQNTQQLLTYIQEIVLGFSCEHPHVLPVKGYHIDFDKRNTWHIYLKLPKMEQSLRSKQQKEKLLNLSELNVVKYFYQLVLGLEYLHKKRIAHRDIKPENILLDKYDQIYLADVGLAKYIEDDSSSIATDMAGTRLYAAPEVSNKNPNLKKKELFKADLWSLGVVMVELCSSKSKIVDAMASVEGKKKELELNNILGEVENSRMYSKVLISIIAGLIKCNPSERKSLAEVRKTLEENYPFLNRRSEKLDNTIQFDLRTEKKKLTIPDVSAIEELEERWKNVLDIQREFPKAIRVLAKDSGEIDDSILKSFSQDLTKFKEITLITKFEMDLSKCEKITDDGVQNLATLLELKLKNIEHLNLNFFSCNQITGDGLFEIYHTIVSKFKHINHLQLDFRDCKRIHEDVFRKVEESFRLKLHNINYLHILYDKNLTNIKDTDFGLAVVGGELVINPGQSKEKPIYREVIIKNTGNRTWPNNSFLQNISGISGQHTKVGPVAPGKEFSCNLLVNQTSVSKEYISTWRLVYYDEKETLKCIGEPFDLVFTNFKIQIDAKITENLVDKLAEIYINADRKDLYQFVISSPCKSWDDLVWNYSSKYNC